MAKPDDGGPGDGKYTERIEQIRNATGAVLGAASLELYRTMAKAMGDLDLDDAQVLEALRGSRDIFTALQVLGIDPAEYVKLDLPKMGGEEATPEYLSSLLGGGAPESRQLPGPRPGLTTPTSTKTGKTIYLSKVLARMKEQNTVPGFRKKVRGLIEIDEELGKYIQPGKRKDSHQLDKGYEQNVINRIRYLLGDSESTKTGKTITLSSVMVRAWEIRGNPKNRKKINQIIEKGSDPVFSKYLRPGKKIGYIMDEDKGPEVLQRIRHLLGGEQSEPGKAASKKKRSKRYLVALFNRLQIYGMEKSSIVSSISTDEELMELVHEGTGGGYFYYPKDEDSVIKRLGEKTGKEYKSRKKTATVTNEDGIPLHRVLGKYGSLNSLITKHKGMHVYKRVSDKLKTSRLAKKHMVTKKVGNSTRFYVKNTGEIQSIADKIMREVERELEAGTGSAKSKIRRLRRKRTPITEGNPDDLIPINRAVGNYWGVTKYCSIYKGKSVLGRTHTAVEADSKTKKLIVTESGKQFVKRSNVNKIRNYVDEHIMPAVIAGIQAELEKKGTAGSDEVLSLGDIEVRFRIGVADMQRYAEDAKFRDILGEPDDMPGGLGKGYSVRKIIELQKKLGSEEL